MLLDWLVILNGAKEGWQLEGVKEREREGTVLQPLHTPPLHNLSMRILDISIYSIVLQYRDTFLFL
jgi:hypothetical protein